MSDAITADQEQQYFLEAGSDTMFAVLTRPRVSNGTGVVLLGGGMWVPSTGRNRAWVTLARAWAAEGFHVVRLDYRGVGESTGVVDNFRLDVLFLEEVRAAVALLRDAGCDDVRLMGTCFGARCAVAAAAELDCVSAIALFPLPIRDFDQGDRKATKPTGWFVRKALTRRALTGWFDPELRRRQVRIARLKARTLVRQALRRPGAPSRTASRTSEPFVRDLERVVARGVDVLMLYGERDDLYDDFQRAQRGRLGELVRAPDSRIEVQVVGGKLHGFTTLAAQDVVSTRVTEWLLRDGAATTHAESA